MTPSQRLSNARLRARAVVAALAVAAAGPSCGRQQNVQAPRAEFIVAAGDSTYWVRSDAAGIKLRGTPLVLARLEGRFQELYVIDDDRSYENALFVGQRLYQRDLVSGDSTEIFRDTLVPSLADRYARRHPDARRLAPDEDPGEEPAVSATADVTVLGVHGPFLSLEYHVDTSGAEQTWHMTRHSVIDLRTGKDVGLSDIVGPGEAYSVLTRARQLYRETVDSVRHDPRPIARRAAQSIAHFHFDASSFSLIAPNGSLMVAFSAPGQGQGGQGFVLPLRPIAVAEPAWWRDTRSSLPTNAHDREERWVRSRYSVRALYDTTVRPVRLSLIDSAGREFAIGGVTAPVHRIYWLDQPPIDKNQRAALAKAFDEAALYDDAARASLPFHGKTMVVSSASSP